MEQVAAEYGYADLQRANWYGVKNIVKRVLGLPPVNRPALTLLNRFPSIQSGLRRFPVGLPNVTCRTRRSGEFTMLDPMSCDVARDVYWGHGWRLNQADRVISDVFESLARDADCVLDVGSYTGYFSLLAAQAGRAKIVAFEIVPENFMALLKNILRNDRVSRIDARLQGVGREGESMRIPTRLNNSVLPSSISTRYRFDSGPNIPFISLDRVEIDRKDRVLIKIDVEGGEDRVLHHSQQLLAAHRPDILCEILPQFGTERFVTQCLTPLGYCFYAIRDWGLVQVEAISANRRYKDWFFSVESPKTFLARATSEEP